jgi:hypothetical protein
MELSGNKICMNLIDLRRQLGRLFLRFIMQCFNHMRLSTEITWRRTFSTVNYPQTLIQQCKLPTDAHTVL